MRDPKGPIKAYKSPEEIANKHKVPLSSIMKQVKIGTKVEGEHTTSKSGAKITALQHVDELPNYYTKLKKVEKVKEGNLHNWFSGSKSKGGKPGWVQSDGSPCANEPGETKTPKCFSSSKLSSMSKGEIRSAVTRKRKEDPGQQSKSGAAKPTYVSTDSPKKKMNKEEIVLESDIKGKGSGKKDACYSKVKARFKVWPSAYASGALVKCRQAGAKNWGNKSEDVEQQYKEDTKYCLLCRKNEKREECSWGPSMWDKYSIAKIHPANESKIYEDHKEIASGKKKDEEGYMARVEFDQIERAVNILRSKIKKGDQQIPAWVQSKITRAADFIDTAADYMQSDEEVSEACWVGYKQVGMKKKGKKQVPNCVPANEDACMSFSEFMLIAEDAKMGKQSDDKLSAMHKQFSSMDQSSPANKFMLNRVQKEINRRKKPVSEGAAWTNKEGKNKSGGLNEKGRKSYEADNPGSDLKAPSKKVGNPRRASFCARMSGMKRKLTSAKTARDPDSRINKSLRAWNC